MNLDLFAASDADEGVRLHEIALDANKTPAHKAEFHVLAGQRLRMLSTIAQCENAEVIHHGRNARGIIGHVELHTDQFNLRVNQNMFGKLGLELMSKAHNAKGYSWTPLPSDLLNSFETLKDRLIAEGVLADPAAVH